MVYRVWQGLFLYIDKLSFSIANFIAVGDIQNNKNQVGIGTRYEENIN